MSANCNTVGALPSSLPPSAVYHDPTTKEALATWSNEKGSEPKLIFSTSDPYKMGVAQGMLLAPQIQAIYQRQIKAMNDSHADSLSSKAQKLEIPKSFKQEMEGLRFGLEKHFEEGKDLSSPLPSLEDIINLHNCIHLHGDSNPIQVDDDLKGKTHELALPIFTREHKVTDPMRDFPESVEMKTYPGFIGVLSASNNCSLTLRVEGFESKSRDEGIPPSLHARQILERCRSVEDVEWDIYGVADPAFKPSGSHKLHAEDSDTTMQFLFNSDGSYTIKTGEGKDTE